MRFSEWITAQLDALRAMVGAEDEQAKTGATKLSMQQVRSPEQLQLKFLSSPAYVSPVRRLIEQFCDDAGLDAPAREEVGLVVNEALANIIRHAYHGDKHQPVLATVEQEGKGVKISLRDWGNGINPATQPRREHDPMTPGGLGLICINRLMDKVSYEPQSDGGILLTMTRTTSGSKATCCEDKDDKEEFA
jgi:anti-sigma regulatory factor (Ser/Thr protein kinase)